MNRTRIAKTRPFIALVAVAGLTACGGSGQDSSGTGTVGGDITYSYWGSPARAEKVNKVIAAYQSANQGVKVTGEVADYNAYIERMTVRAAGGGLPCVIGTQSTFIAPYAEKNVLLPLDDLIESKAIDVSQIPEDVLKAGRIDDKQYMIPTGTFVRLVAYNVDLVEKSGAAAPTNDLTWAAYADWLKQVQQGLPPGKYAGEIEAGNMFSFTSWVVGHGQQMFADGALGFDKQLMIDWFDYWLDLQKAGATVPPSMLADQQLSLEQTPLAKGVAVSGTRDIPHLYITEKALAANGLGTSVKAVSIPVDGSVPSANVLGSNGLSIPKSCDNKATAASFINFFANDKAAALAFQSDNGILTNTANQEALLSDGQTPGGVKQNVAILRDLTGRSDLATSSYPDGLSTLTAELTRLYQQVAFGKATPEEATDGFFDKAAQALR